ncbi:hypothetical protein WA026_022780 [Henosepilachna vigintioctopunctata]|uniref:Uncharacterized protein n=1 Tax=Henosepilachna vigintioctopunctata TaxID=420089 RepID=A0AAW1VDL3_9CUCU
MDDTSDEEIEEENSSEEEVDLREKHRVNNDSNATKQRVAYGANSIKQKRVSDPIQLLVCGWKVFSYTGLQ